MLVCCVVFVYILHSNYIKKIIIEEKKNKMIIPTLHHNSTPGRTKAKSINIEETQSSAKYDVSIR